MEFLCNLEFQISFSKQKKDSFYFPSELLLDILLRLPVKSLIRFKSVHSYWFSLISSPEFRRKHVSHNPVYKYGVIRAECLGSSRYCLSLRIFNSAAEDFIDDEALAIPNPFVRNFSVDVLGSYNGLVLISIGSGLHVFILWNPSTREYHKIFRPEVCQLFGMAGLGHDASNDDYKIVTGFYFLSKIGMEVRIYSLKTRRWEKKIHHFSYNFDSFSPGMTPANGTPHWLASTNRNSYEDILLYFDMADNDFKEVSLPEQFHCRCQFISVLHGNICVGRFQDSFKYLYVMKEYASKYLWIKLSMYSSPIPESRCVAPVGFASKNIVIVSADTSGLVIYCRNTNQYRTVKRWNNTYAFKVAFYAQSLESPCKFSGGDHRYVSVPLHVAGNGQAWIIAGTLLLVFLWSLH